MSEWWRWCSAGLVPTLAGADHWFPLRPDTWIGNRKAGVLGHTMARSRTECEGQIVGDDDLTLTNRLIQAGSDIVGTVSGAGLGLLIAGPPGALAGAGMAPVLSTPVSMGAEFAQRRLSP